MIVGAVLLLVTSSRCSRDSATATNDTSSPNQSPAGSDSAPVGAGIDTGNIHTVE
jgi:hypothetical protein